MRSVGRSENGRCRRARSPPLRVVAASLPVDTTLDGVEFVRFEHDKNNGNGDALPFFRLLSLERVANRERSANAFRRGKRARVDCTCESFRTAGVHEGSATYTRPPERETHGDSERDRVPVGVARDAHYMSFAFRVNGFNYYLPPLSSSSRARSVCFPVHENSSTELRHAIDRHNEQVLRAHCRADSLCQSEALRRFDPTRSTRRGSSPMTDERPTVAVFSSGYLSKYMNKSPASMPLQADRTLVLGNSIIKSNKAETLHAFEQQSGNGVRPETYVDRHGVLIDEHGPFWPETFDILHPTPKLTHRRSPTHEPYASRPITSRNAQSTVGRTRHVPLQTRPIIVKRSTSSRRSSSIPIRANIRRSSSTWREQRDNNRRAASTTSSRVPRWCSSRVSRAATCVKPNECNSVAVRSVASRSLVSVCRGPFEYELVLRPDLYTRRHTQWFFFRVQNMRDNVTYRFRMINLTKKNSLYNDGDTSTARHRRPSRVRLSSRHANPAVLRRRGQVTCARMAPRRPSHRLCRAQATRAQRTPRT
jgi:hypothetical protein